MTPELNDTDLLRQAGCGDASALRELMLRYDTLVRYAVFRYSRTQCRQDPQWLDDLASQCWSAVVNGAGFEASLPDNVPGFLFTLARNRTVSATRAAGRAMRRAGALKELLDVSGELAEDVSEVVERWEALTKLRGLLDLLEGEERRIFTEAPLILDRRWTEAARRLDLPESTLRSAWARLIGRLRTLWEAGGGEQASRL